MTAPTSPPPADGGTVDVTSVASGKTIDTWTFSGGTITAAGDTDDILESLQGRYADGTALWDALNGGGWSNGYLRVGPPEEQPADAK